MPYSNDAYAVALKEAKQFLWAGSEMDPVRLKSPIVFYFIYIFGKKNCIYLTMWMKIGSRTGKKLG